MHQQLTAKLSPVRAPAALLVLIALVLAGCAPTGPNPSTSDRSAAASPEVSKKVFLLRLIGFCAGVDRRLQQAGPTPAPALIARELAGFVVYARNGPVPAEDRPQFQKMVTALAGAAAKHDELDSAQRSGSQEHADHAAAVAKVAYSSANAEAQRYGMPDLKDCEKTMEQERGRWSSLADAPMGVQQMGAAVLDGVIWLAGGLAHGQTTDNVMGYDVAIDTWTFGPPLPTPLHHAMAVAYRGELVVLGGFIPAGSQLSASASGRVYHLRQGVQWEEYPSMRHARAAGAAVVVGDRIVVVGGRDPHQLVPATEVFDGTVWRDAQPLPVPGDHLAAVAAGTSVYAVGGRNLSADKNTGALQRYDVDADRWTRLADMPTPRGGLGAGLLAGAIIAVGGEAPTAAYDTAEAYDLASGNWSTLHPLPGPRHGMAVAAVGDRLFAVGGFSTAGHLGSGTSGTVLQLEGASTIPAASAAGETPSVTPTVAGTATTAATPAAGVAATAAQPTIYQCPPGAQPGPRACLTSASRSSTGLAIAYTTNFTPSQIEDGSHYHLHLFTANTKDGRSTDPSDSVMRMAAAPNEGSWFSIYASGVSRIDARTRRAGRKAPVDFDHFSLLCVRVASGQHELARDPSGGFSTGNCVPIQR